MLTFFLDKFGGQSYIWTYAHNISSGIEMFNIFCDYHRNSAIHQCSAVGAALAAKRAGKEMELFACQPGKFADKSAPTLILRRLFTQEAEN